jgi:hypothetical protein
MTLRLSLVCLLLTGLLGGCRGASTPTPLPRDDWYRAPPKEHQFYWNWPELDAARIHIVVEDEQANAQKLLEQVALAEITTQQAGTFLGRTLPGAPGTTPYLVRGLYRNPGTGNYAVYVGEDQIVVHHGSLGSRSPPVARQALIVQLEDRPAQVYVLSSVNR